MPSFGLDVSDESIKFMQLRHTTTGIRVGRHGEKKIPPGIMEDGKVVDPARMQDILSDLRQKEGVKSVRVSLPEEQIYLFKMRLEKEGLTNIRENIELTLEEHIPIQAQNTIFDYEILGEDEKGLDLEVVAIPDAVIGNYLEVFRGAGISVQSVELEAQAIARAVIKQGDMDTYMIVDFGEKRTGISIISRGIAMFTSTVDVGGSILTSTIMKSLGVSREEADRLKKEYGLQRNMENKEVFSLLLNSVSVLRDEVAKHFLYWHTHKDEQGKDNPPIKKILLCGGDSNLIGLSEYFSVSMKTQVEMANVWTNISDPSRRIPEMTFKRALSFAAALGLALGDFEHD